MQYIKNKNNIRKYFHEQSMLMLEKQFLYSAKSLIPSIEQEDIIRSDKKGIRPQLFNIEKEKLEDDFTCLNNMNSTHVLNALSPAFTASFELADLIIKQSNFK